MKRRAIEQGATASEARPATEDGGGKHAEGYGHQPHPAATAASQLTTGNQDIGLPPHGAAPDALRPDASDSAKVSAGTLELLGQKEIVERNDELNLPDDRIASEEVWTQGGEAMEDAVDAIKTASE